MAINHFPTTEAAEAHLSKKGFRLAYSTPRTFISRDGWVEARINVDPHRGPYVQFREKVAA